MRQKLLRVAVVGCGVGRSHIAQGYRRHPDKFRLQALCDIYTPATFHFEQILAALSAGKEVVCEKPLVLSLAEIDRVIVAENTATGRVMPIFQYRFGNGVQKAKRIIDLGIAGK